VQDSMNDTMGKTQLVILQDLPVLIFSLKAFWRPHRILYGYTSIVKEFAHGEDREKGVASPFPARRNSITVRLLRRVIGRSHSNGGSDSLHFKAETRNFEPRGFPAANVALPDS
jgi:hypothetical protein